ncbi:MAG: Gfo/Idh/MocA family protein [Planctomycetota bacterium]|jgi:predicted dehydrogenase
MELDASLTSATAPVESVAVIGFGYWGPNVVRSLQQLGCRRLGIVDTSLERLTAAQKEFPSCEVSDDALATLRSGKWNACVIATPVMTHAPLVRAALKSGVHVLCEKPLCLNSQDAHDLKLLAVARDRVLMTGFVYLFHPTFERIQELVAAGVLGSIRYITMTRANPGPVRSDVDCVADLASHDISMLLRLLGEQPVEVSARGASFLQPGTSDMARIWLQFPDGVSATLEATWLHPEKIRRVTVVGSKATLIWDELDTNQPLQLIPMVAKDHVAGTWNVTSGVPEGQNVASTPSLVCECRHFLETVRGERPNPADGQFSADVSQVLESIGRSMAAGGQPVFLSCVDDRDESRERIATSSTVDEHVGKQ